jgi:hypothetical protein
MPTQQTISKLLEISMKAIFFGKLFKFQSLTSHAHLKSQIQTTFGLSIHQLRHYHITPT